MTAEGKARATTEATDDNSLDLSDSEASPPDALQPRKKPRLLVETWNPDKTIAKLRDILAAAGSLYERGVPVRLAVDQLREEWLRRL